MIGPLVSVIIPAYNSEKYLPECLESIRQQTYKNWEAIIVVAPSTDLTFETAMIASMEDSRFKVIKEIKKTTCAHARNTGYEASRGEYVYFLDADDWLEPDCFKIFIEEFDRFCWCVSYQQTHNQCTIPDDYPDNYIIKVVPGTHTGIGGIGGIMFKRKTLESIKKEWGYIFLESLSHTDDGDLTLRLWPYSIKIVPLVLSHYRWHDDNLTINTNPIEQEWGLTKMCVRNKRYEFIPYHAKNLAIVIGNRIFGRDLVKWKKEIFGSTTPP